MPALLKALPAADDSTTDELGATPSDSSSDRGSVAEAGNVARWLAQTPDVTPDDLLAISRREMECRWRGGVHLSAEDLCGMYPLIRNHSRIFFELVLKEFTLRKDWGESPTLEEYARRYPRLRRDLQRRLAALEALKRDGMTGAGLRPLPAHSSRPDPTIAVRTDGEDEAASGVDRRPYLCPVEMRYLAGYEILEEVGRGSMGVVYRARQQSLNRIVALKLLLTGPFAQPQERAMFLKEAELVGSLRHPNVVEMYDTGDVCGHAYHAMEYIPGPNLAQLVADGKVFGPREAARLVEAIARGVHAAHEAAIIHRDVKPANILIAPDGIPKIIDFGLARRLDLDVRATRSGVIVGTPRYMAPEQAQGHVQQLGPGCDIYSLGVILYELLTGRLPFIADHPLEMLRQVIEAEPVPPSRVNAVVAGDLERVCLHCLEKDPSRRYASAAELADDLVRFLSGQAVAIRLGRAARSVRHGLRGLIAVGGGAIRAVLERVGLAAQYAITWLRKRLSANHPRKPTPPSPLYTSVHLSPHAPLQATPSPPCTR